MLSSDQRDRQESSWATNGKFTVDSSWGVESVRQCAGFPLKLLKNRSRNFENDVCYVCPLGSLIVCWDIASRERVTSFQAHSELITCMLYNSSHRVIITGSYSGELKLWDEQFTLQQSQQLDAQQLHFAALSECGDKLVLLYDKSGDSYLALYEVGLSPVGGQFLVSLKWKIHVKSDSKDDSASLPAATGIVGEANDRVGCSSCHDSPKAGTCKANSVHSFELELPNDVQAPGPSGSDEVLHPTVADKHSCTTFVKIQDGYVITLVTSIGNIVGLFQRHDHFSEAHLYDMSGKLLESQVLDPLGDKNSSILCTSPCHNGVFAIGFQGGLFLILSEADLTVASVLQATGSPQVAVWDGDFLLAFSYLSGHISWWTASGELVHELQGGPKGSIIHLDWAVPGKELWVGGIMSLHYVTLEKASHSNMLPSKLTEKYQLQFHRVTGCGVAFTDQDKVISGDFTGTLFMWEKANVEPVSQARCSGAVRCITWSNGAAYCGCLDGTLTKWAPQQPLVTVLSCAGSVLTMSWTEDSSQLAIGLESGHLAVYMFGSEPVELLNIAAHHLKRGGTDIPAEIWSLCWSPCEVMIATASEDQTTCIWNVAGGKLTRRLTQGHRLTIRTLCINLQ